MNEKKAKNLYIWVMILTILCAVITGVCGIVILHFQQSGEHDYQNKTSYDKYYVMIAEDHKSSFWKSVYQGAYDRGIGENVYVDWFGEELLKEYSIEEQMKMAVAANVDGIIVKADQGNTMKELIDCAAGEDIPVITVYEDNPQSSRLSFVGVSSYNLGQEYGKLAVRVIEKRLRMKNSHVELEIERNENTYLISSQKRPARITVLVDDNTQDLDTDILYSGIQESIEKEKMRDTVVEVSLFLVDDTNTFSAEETIRDIFMGEEIPDIIICLNELNTTCVYQAVVDYNKVGEVYILGYYDSDTIVNAINRDVIYATVTLDTEQMGACCVDAFQEYYESGYTSQYFAADTTLIQKSNVAQYLEKEEPDGKKPFKKKLLTD